MALVRVGKLERLPAGSVMELVEGEQPYAICNPGGRITALNGVCPHRGGPLGQGQIHNGRVVCPYHYWEFDCSTGECSVDPDKRVATYDVKVEGGEIFLQVP